MTLATEAALQSFVVLPLGSRRVAFAGESVIELVAPSKLQTFPHGTSWISGVLVCRNRVVPVCHVNQLFGGHTATENRFYLIAEWQNEHARDWCAIPVCGECGLASAEMKSVQSDDLAAANAGPFVVGFISVDSEKIAVIDLAKLIEARRLAPIRTDEEPAR